MPPVSPADATRAPPGGGGHRPRAQARKESLGSVRWVRPGSLPVLAPGLSLHAGGALCPHLSAFPDSGRKVWRPAGWRRSCGKQAAPAQGLRARGPEPPGEQAAALGPVPGLPAVTLRALWAVWVMGEVTATGGVLPFRGPGGPRPPLRSSRPWACHRRLRRRLPPPGPIFRLLLSYQLGGLLLRLASQLSPLRQRSPEVCAQLVARERAGRTPAGQEAGTGGERGAKEGPPLQGTLGPGFCLHPRLLAGHSAPLLQVDSTPTAPYERAWAPNRPPPPDSRSCPR